MKKKSLPLWIAISLLALLVFCYVLLVKYNADIALKEETEESVLSVQADEIVSVSFMLEEQEETFVREDETWTLSSDKDFVVEDSMLDLLVSDVTDMTMSRSLNDVKNLTEYGLDTPVQTVALKDKTGKIYTVCWGSSNSVTGDDYCYVKENPSVVYTVDNGVIQGFSETLEEYRKTETTEEEISQ